MNLFSYSFVGRYLASCIIFLLFRSLVSAQELHKVNGADGQLALKPIAIGDTVPKEFWDMSFQMLQADKQTITVKMSDFRGKVILLDYWATWCTGCILNMPRVHNDVHGLDDVVLLPVTGEKEEVVKKFLSITASESIAKVRSEFRSILDGYALSDMVPHKAIPFIAIINKAGVLEQTTLPTFFDNSTLKAIANGEPYYIPTYRKSVDKPLLSHSYPDVRQVSPVYYSTIMGIQKGFVVPHRQWADSSKNVIYGYKMNIPIQLFLDIAVDAQGASFRPARRIMLVDTPSRFDYFHERNPKYLRRKYDITYEYSFPLSWSKEQIGNRMLSDVNDYLGLYAAVVRKEMPCLVLRLKKGAKLPIVKRDEHYGFVYDEILFSSRYKTRMGRSKSGAKNYLLGESTATLPFVLNELKLDVLPFVIDEIGFEQFTLIDFPDDMSSVEDLIKVFDRQGIIVSRELREVDMYVMDNKPIDEQKVKEMKLELTKFGYVPARRASDE